MKRILYSLLLIILVAGLSGCMKQPTEKENKDNAEAMLNYLRDTYSRDFTKVEYILVKRGFNDFISPSL